MKTKIAFTKTAIERIEPSSTRTTYHDTKSPGLVCLASPSGGKVFYVYRRINGRPERIKLGVFPSMTVEQARNKAAEVNGAIAGGANPAQTRRAIKAEPTFSEVFERYLKEKRNRAGKPLAERTATEYLKIVTTYLGSIKNMKLSQITPERVKATAAKVQSPSQANKVKATVSAVYNWARDEGVTDRPNPAQAIKSKAIPSRDRFLLPSELPAFMAAVEVSPLRDFFLLALFTGARRSNIQEMRWQDVNLEEFTWTIPKTKNGDPQTITLSPEAVEILQSRKEAAIFGAVYVFPGRGKTKPHLVEPKRAWDQVIDAAGLENLRIHDLRRTLGSWQARQGTSLTIIGKSLGHKSQQATAIYSRIDLDPVRQSVDSAAAAMIEAARRQEEDENH
jgi:integrase